MKNKKLNKTAEIRANNKPIKTALNVLVAASVIESTIRTKAIVKIEVTTIIPLYWHKHFDNAFFLFEGRSKRIIIIAKITAAITAK